MAYLVIKLEGISESTLELYNLLSLRITELFIYYYN
jgi:hypothetical protein